MKNNNNIMKKTLSIVTGFLLIGIMIGGVFGAVGGICPLGKDCTNNDWASYLNADSVAGCENGACTEGAGGNMNGPRGQPRASANHPSGFPNINVGADRTNYGGGQLGDLSLPGGSYPQGGGDPGQILLSLSQSLQGFVQTFAAIKQEDETGDGGSAVSSGPHHSGNPAQDSQIGEGKRELTVLENGNIDKLRGQTASVTSPDEQRLDITNNQKGTASVKFNGATSDTNQQNTATTFYQDDEAIVSVQTPKDTETNIVVNPFATNGALPAFILPLADKIIAFLSRTLVSAQQGTGQHMHLNGKDIDKSGNNIRTIPHIDLENYDAGGQELVLEIGIKTRVHNQRIDANPLLDNLDISIDKYSNKLAPINDFIITSDPNSMGVIRSEDGTFFMTDRTSNPGAASGDYARLLINTERLEMFS